MAMREWYFIHEFVGVIPQQKHFQYIVWQPGRQTIEGEAEYPDDSYKFNYLSPSGKLLDNCERLQSEWLPSFLIRLRVHRMQEKRGMPWWERVKISNPILVSEYASIFNSLVEPIFKFSPTTETSDYISAINLNRNSFAHVFDKNQRVSEIRHNCTDYEARLKRNDQDYLATFIAANTLIMQVIPELKDAALEQIKRKRRDAGFD